MADDTRTFVTLVTAVGCALTAGVFFAFSTFVMRGLGRIEPTAGISAMQAINVTAVNPWLMTLLFGSAVGSLVLLVTALTGMRHPQAGLLLAGGICYLLGVMAVTAVCNIPRNNALAAMDATATTTAQYWQQYLTSWTLWNHVRLAGSLVAAVAFTLALARG